MSVLTMEDILQLQKSLLSTSIIERMMAPSLIFDRLPVRPRPEPTWEQRLERLLDRWVSALMTCSACGCDGWSHED